MSDGETAHGGMLQRLALRALHCLEPERAHDLALWSLQHGLFPAAEQVRDERLRTSCCGLRFANPLGMAAGFDKDARVAPALWNMGFGFVEVGTLTPRPQPGNARPRLFRLREDEAIINRFGFNNAGQAAARRQLQRWHAMIGRGVLGVNVGANKDSADRIADYAAGALALADVADYLAVNISSPNTPGLRDLQGPRALEKLLAAVGGALAEAGREQCPVLVKIAPDIDEAELAEIIEVAISGGAAGLIVSNTTIARPETLRSPQRGEAGGLSGRPLFEPSTRLLAQAHVLAKGRLRLIGVGGVHDAKTAWEKIRAGADLVQLLSAFVYHGPALIPRILRGLLLELERAGHASIGEAVGSGAHDWLEK